MKDGAGIQDEYNECLSASRGRRFLDFYECNEVKNLEICDQIPESAHCVKRDFARLASCAPPFKYRPAVK